MTSESTETVLLVAGEVDEATHDEPIPLIYPELAPRTRGGFFGAIEWMFGVVSLFLGLAILTAIPILQFLTLGYMLESSGRVARNGRLRDGFIGVRIAARIGGFAAGAFVLWLPLYAISYMADRARIVDPEGRIARQWDAWLIVLTSLYALQVVAASLKGGRLRSFFWPLNIFWLFGRGLRVNVVREARDRLWNFVVELRLPYYFWFGLRGFLGAFLWLLVPVALLGQGHRVPLLGVLGGVLLGIVVLYLPFLQTRFARDGKLRAFVKILPVRRAFRRAPLAFALALSLHLLLAMPLYILKIEVIPRDLMYLEGLVFLAFMFPVRLVDGWAYSRSQKRKQPRFFLFRWAGRLGVLPVVTAYVLVVFTSQHIGWYGVSSLFEQHAFLLPVPFAK